MRFKNIIGIPVKKYIRTDDEVYGIGYEYFSANTLRV